MPRWNPPADPDQKAIERMCEEFRATWSDAVKATRAGGPLAGWEPPEVSTRVQRRDLPED